MFLLSYPELGLSNTVLPVLASAVTASDESVRPIANPISSLSSSNISSISSTHPVLLKKYFRYKFKKIILAALKREEIQATIVQRQAVLDRHKPEDQQMVEVIDPEFILNYNAFHHQIPVPNGELLLGPHMLYDAILKSSNISGKLEGEELSREVLDNMNITLNVLLEQLISKASNPDGVDEGVKYASSSKDRLKQSILKLQELNIINKYLKEATSFSELASVKLKEEMAERVAVKKKPDVIVTCGAYSRAFIPERFHAEENDFLASRGSGDPQMAYGFRGEPIRDGATNHIRLAYLDDRSVTFPFRLYIQPGALIYETFQTIDRAINDGKQVYIHCTEGVSRSPAVAILYIATRAGVSFDEAYKFIKLYRHIIRYPSKVSGSRDSSMIMKFFRDNFDSVNALCNPISDISPTVEKVADVLMSYLPEMTNPVMDEVFENLIQNLVKVF